VNKTKYVASKEKKRKKEKKKREKAFNKPRSPRGLEYKRSRMQSHLSYPYRQDHAVSCGPLQVSASTDRLVLSPLALGFK